MQKIPEGHEANFETILHAAQSQRLCLISTKLKATNEDVCVICGINVEEDGSCTMVPLAMMFNENPYELLIPPTEDENAPEN